jgi:hypothetical protein
VEIPRTSLLSVHEPTFRFLGPLISGPTPS